MELEIGDGFDLAGLTFPNYGGLVLSPCRKVTVETVVRNIDLAANKPFRVRLIPFEHGVPFAKPMEILSLFGPKRLRISGGLSIDPLIFLKALDVCVGGKIRRWREDAVFVKN